MCQRRKAPPPGPRQIQESARKRRLDATRSAWASVARSIEPPCGAITATVAQERRTVVSSQLAAAEDVGRDVDGRPWRFVHEQPAQRRVAQLRRPRAAAGCRHGVGDDSAAGIHQDLPTASGRAEVRRDGKIQERERFHAQGDLLAGRIEVRGSTMPNCTLVTATMSRPPSLPPACSSGEPVPAARSGPKSGASLRVMEPLSHSTRRAGSSDRPATTPAGAIFGGPIRVGGRAWSAW